MYDDEDDTYDDTIEKIARYYGDENEWDSIVSNHRPNKWIIDLAQKTVQFSLAPL